MSVETQTPFIDRTLSGENQNKVNSNSTNYNERIEGTPLWIVKTKDDKWLLTFGQYRLKEGDSKEDLLAYTEQNLLNIVVDLITIIIEIQNKQ
ncbi:MAG: hypothetical protein [Microviridae sp.]|nr:MAG: hypothetical protein [Microviridae sp.]